MRTKYRIDNKKTALLIREAILKIGLTQTDLANKIGIKQYQVSRFLKGNFRRTPKYGYALCNYFKVIPVVKKNPLKLRDYPDLALCLDEVLDGSRKRERAIIRLLKSAQIFNSQ